MTFRELFNEVEKRGLMDAKYGVKYRDAGGEYYGFEDEDDELGIREKVTYEGEDFYLL